MIMRVIHRVHYHPHPLDGRLDTAGWAGTRPAEAKTPYGRLHQPAQPYPDWRDVVAPRLRAWPLGS
jgi:hypothetical protein